MPIIIRTNMIDLHTHLLPKIDDGAADLDEALQITKTLISQNVSCAVCTPHFDPTQSSIQEFVEHRTAAMKLMSEAKLELIPASETSLHEYLLHYPDLSELCIHNTNYLLLELPFDRKWDQKMYETVSQLIHHYNLCPIIAHIERYPATQKHKKRIRKLIKMGCLIQMNTTFISNKKTQKRAFRYIKKGYVDVLGSDCHNMIARLPVIKEAMDLVNQKCGLQYGDKFNWNAKCIVKGMDIRKKDTYLIE